MKQKWLLFSVFDEASSTAGGGGGQRAHGKPLGWRLAPSGCFARINTWTIYQYYIGYIGFTNRPTHLSVFQWPVHSPTDRCSPAGASFTMANCLVFFQSRRKMCRVYASLRIQKYLRLDSFVPILVAFGVCVHVKLSLFSSRMYIFLSRALRLWGWSIKTVVRDI